jgi:hypothetical protein
VPSVGPAGPPSYMAGRWLLNTMIKCDGQNRRSRRARIDRREVATGELLDLGLVDALATGLFRAHQKSSPRSLAISVSCLLSRPAIKNLRVQRDCLLRNGTTSATNLGEVTRLWPSSGYMISRPCGIRHAVSANGRSAHRDQGSGPPGQRRGPAYGDTEEHGTNHEQDRRQS